MNRRKSLANLQQDLREHIEIETQDNIDRGMSPDEARRAAMLKFGNAAQIAEDTRAVWTPVWMEQLLQDARYALRTLRRNKGFATVVVLTLALGIGMNTAVFSVVNAVLLRPLSAPDSERLLWLSLYDKQWGEEWVSEWDFLDWREQSTSFQRIAAYDVVEAALKTEEGPARVQFARVSEDFWEIAGAHAQLGRLPASGEQDAIVLSHRLFEQHFGSDPAAIGRPVSFERTYTVVGVLPVDFRFEFPAGFVPFEFSEVSALITNNPRRGSRGTPNVVAQLKPGVPISRVRDELAAIHARSSGNPRDTREMEVRVMPLLEKRVGEARLALWTLLAAVGFVLLIACVNIANLLLARASARSKEIAIRASLGAGRARVLRQFLVESTLLALLGGATGLLFARWGITVMLSLIPKAIPRLAETTIDGWVLLFALAASFATALLFGLAPIASLRKLNLHDVLKDGARTSAATPRNLRLRKLLVVAELAMAVVLLSGAGLMIKSYWRMNAHPPGFDPERILIVKIATAGLRDPARGKTYVADLLRGLSALPGVEAASVMQRGPADARWEGVPHAQEEEPPVVIGTATAASYPKVLGLRLLKGRWFHEGENAIVVNDSLARRDFSGREPLGQRLTPGGAIVVGVVADLKYSKLDAVAEPEFFISYSAGGRFMETTLVIRTAGQPSQIALAVRNLIAGGGSPTQVLNVTTMEQALSDSIAPRRFNLFLLGTFAAAALLLAIIGIYGVVAYAVIQRTHEIGVRIALGARRRSVAGMVVRQGVVIAAAGILLGLALAGALTRLMGSLLYDVRPNDPQTFAAVALALTATVLLACWAPALRAARVDPAVALRYE